MTRAGYPLTQNISSGVGSLSLERLEPSTSGSTVRYLLDSSPKAVFQRIVGRTLDLPGCSAQNRAIAVIRLSEAFVGGLRGGTKARTATARIDRIGSYFSRSLILVVGCSQLKTPSASLYKTREHELFASHPRSKWETLRR